MNKIDLFFIALLTIGVISMVRTEFTSITGDVVNECIDSDSGIDPFVGGNLIGYDETTKKDFCANATTLYEYYCDGERSKGVFEETYCKNGCSTKDGKGVCLQERELKESQCDKGCYYRGVCLDVGMRVNRLYCDSAQNLRPQLLDDTINCENNFECKSNLCIVGKCVSKEIFDKFLASLNSA